jgi:hypothetical protein
MKKTPLRVVCPNCRSVIAETAYNYQKQQWNFVIKEECCEDSIAMLSKSVMNDICEKEVSSTELDEGYNGSIEEPSFYDWESNR